MQPEQDRFIEEIFKKSYLSLLRQAEKKLGDPVLAQDVTQDTFYTAVNRIDVLMAHENPVGWLTKALDYKIKRIFEKRTQELGLFAQEGSYEEPSQPDASIQALEGEGGEMIEKIQERLTADEFHYITRLVVDGATHQELGEEFHVTQIGSKKKRERIIKKLNKAFPEFSEKTGEKDEKEKV